MSINFTDPVQGKAVEGGWVAVKTVLIDVQH